MGTVRMSTPSRDRVLVADPCAQPNPSLVVAALRAGAVGILDVATVRGDGAADAVAELLADVTRRSTSPFAVRIAAADGGGPRHLRGSGGRGDQATDLPEQVDTIVVAGPHTPDGLRAAVAAWAGRRVLVEVVSAEEAAAALVAGADGLVAKGCESGGRVGDVESFVLAQQIARLDAPYWVQGGVGLRTAAGAVAGGACGVLLDGQLALLRESGLGDDARAAVGAMDGSETRVVGGHRVYVRPDLPSAGLDDAVTSFGSVAERLGPDLHDDLLPLGQDAACAAGLADRYVTVGGVVQALRAAIDSQLAAAVEHRPLAPGAGVSTTHGATHPVVQGPMTRVSDKAELAAAVAAGGGLPFLALALLPGPEVRALLTQTAELLGDRPWGVGVLGFVPPEVRAEQLEVIHEVRPPVALIAGGRPSQAQPLEAAGITTYLHVPSPGLLDRFLRDGARRFVFEGRECGGHVGPRASFPLWEAQVERLLALDDAALAEVDLLFAGGIHDARSAAMVAAIAAPLVARGARIGVLMGTAYLFTEEAVDSGAITGTFQDVARSCSTTVLLETSPGHATRCVETDYVRAFASRKAELAAAGTPAKDMWAELESLNLGRLRIASKGVTRAGEALVPVDATTQLHDGMYMIGQVASLRRDPTTVAALHDEVTAGATAHLASLVAEERRTRNLRVAARDRAIEADDAAQPLDVAIVGMAGMFPGAADTERYWANIVTGIDAVTEVPRDRWDPEVFYDPAATGASAGHRTPSRWGGFLPWVPFDALAYGIPPRSLAAIESVQLLSLEAANRALADAGYDRREFDRSRASVIFGSEGGNDLGGAYGFRAAFPHFVGSLPPSLDAFLPAPTEDSFPGVLTNVIAGRIANRLDLGGVNYTVDAACAASLAALDAACKELVGGTSDLVLCGAADVHNGINDYLMFSSVHALSPSGRCRTFDSSADGIALGEGIACVVLKRRADAERDGDRIYAVIEGIGGSSDGRHLGLTAPRKDGQVRALDRAYAGAGVAPSSVGLVEAHGTGTVVGDRTELATLTEVFSASGASVGGAVLGSVKSQIGHTKCAAGLAGLIKAARSVYTGVLPPTRNVETPNDYYEAESSPFRFLGRALPWPAVERRAAVSAFGFGGTNFHAVLRAHADDERPRHGLAEWPAELFLLRAESAESLAARVADLQAVVARVVEADPDGLVHRLRDLAWTVSSSGTGPVRCAVVATDFADLARQLASATGSTAEPGKVAFLHPGQGSQRVGMLADLFVAFPHLQSVLRSGNERWADAMFPGAAFTQAERDAQVAALTDTRVAQPALGIAALALTRLLADLGVEADMAGGHSYGELAALATAGVFDDDTLVDLSEARGAAMVAAAASLGDDPGAMAAVALAADELAPRLGPDVVIANHNGPRQTVVAGPTAAVEALVAALADEKISAKRLPVAAAFHSPLVARAADVFADCLTEVDLGEPHLPVWSNATATVYEGTPESIRSGLAAQLGQPVRFVEQVEAMYATGARVFVEVGPGRVLTQLVGRILGDRPHTAVACDAAGENGVQHLLRALASLAEAGVAVDVRPLFEGRARRVDTTALPVAAPGWRVNGHLVCTNDGEPVSGGLQPADRIPEVVMNHGGPAQAPEAGAATTTDRARDAAVLEYLRSVQQIVGAQREVMLRYLGELPPELNALLPALPELPVLPVEYPASVPHSNGHGSGSGNGSGNGSHGNGRHEVVTAAAPVLAPLATPESLPLATPAPVPVAPSGDELLAVILAVVAERTGYPLDMLDPDLDLEADLSIDSIKRIEIIGELAERVGLAGDDAMGLDESVVEQLAQLKSLRAIVAWLDDNAATFAPPPATGAAYLDPTVLAPWPTPPTPAGIGPSGTPAPAAQPGATGIPADATPATGLPATGAAGQPGHPDAPGTAAVPADPAGVVVGAASLVRSNRAGNGNRPGPTQAESHVAVATLPPTRRFVLETAMLAPALPVAPAAGKTFILVSDPWEGLDELRRLLERSGATVEVVATHRGVPSRPLPDAVAARLAQVDGVVHLGAADAVAPVDARDVFAALKPAITGRATTLVAAVARGVRTAPNVVSGVPGLMRSIARELPEHHVRAVELSDRMEPAGVVARLLADEILDPAGPVSVAYNHGKRTTRRVAKGTDLGPDVPAAPFDNESVVVLTGGARGITAKAALAIARESQCRIELLGRSSLPGDEDLRTAAALDRPALRRVLLEAGELRTPAEIEPAIDRITADREIRATMAQLRAVGSPTTYHSVDVRDSQALARVLGEIREYHGRIDAVVHGAGVLDDRLARDKTDAGFDRVFATKVDGARTLLDHLGDDVRLVVFFGSVSGVFGNRGQVDYSAANDALDELALRFDGAEGRRVVSIDWGPWSGTGMVSPELEREYARRGVGLVDPDEGVRALLTEMGTLPGEPAQVVVMRAEPATMEGRPPSAPGSWTPTDTELDEPPEPGDGGDGFALPGGLTLEDLTERG